MLFTSIEFVIFVVAVMAAYWCPPLVRLGACWQWGVLSVSSLIFYAWEDPRLLILLGFSIVFNFVGGRRIAARLAEGGKASHRLMVIWVTVNLLLLAVFKYAGLLGDLLFAGEANHALRSWLHGIPLPIGISFYTFHAISFLVDLSRAGDREPLLRDFAKELAGPGWLRPFGKVALYINFFPQLVAGPIMKARDFMPQIAARTVREIQWRAAFRFLIAGCFLKMVVGDNLKEHTETIATTNVMDMRKLDLLGLLYGYSFRIFADFAGYSLMALGLAALFGYRLPVNFNYPYLAASVTEFWRRWHVSLSTWLRDYLYFPLGGNRKGTARTYLNLFLVMFLGGLWHGAAWRFALWGAAHGIILAIERLLGVKSEETSVKNRSLRQVFGMVLTFNLVSWIWLLFAMPDMEALMRYLRALVDAPMGLRGRATFILAIYGLPVVAYHLWGYFRPGVATASNSRGRSIVEAAAYGLMLYLILTNSGLAGTFIYFQF